MDNQQEAAIRDGWQDILSRWTDEPGTKGADELHSMQCTSLWYLEQGFYVLLFELIKVWNVFG